MNIQFTTENSTTIVKAEFMKKFMESNVPLYEFSERISSKNLESSCFRTVEEMEQFGIVRTVVNKGKFSRVCVGPDRFINIGLDIPEDEYEDSDLKLEQKIESGKPVSFFISIVTPEKKLVEMFQKMQQAYKLPPKSCINMVIPTSNGSFRITPIADVGLPLVKDNYSAESVEAFKQIIKGLKSSNPTGRLAVLDGPPGTGKTHYIRSLMHAYKEATYIFVPSNMISDLSGPTFVSALFNNKSDDGPMVLVLEDADAALTSRSSDNVSIVSTLLNLTDGLLGESLNIRVIASTNARTSEFDSAIMRPGRLLKHVHLGKLDKEQCNRIFKRLTKKEGDITENMTIGDIYAKAFSAPVQTNSTLKKSSKIGF